MPSVFLQNWQSEENKRLEGKSSDFSIEFYCTLYLSASGLRIGLQLSQGLAMLRAYASIELKKKKKKYHACR